MPVTAYRVEVEPAAQRDLHRLATTLYERVTGRLAKLAEELRPHGVLKLTLQSDSYQWEFVPVAGGAGSDSGTGTCH